MTSTKSVGKSARASASGVSLLLRSVRSYVIGDLREANEQACAAELGLSKRTLQRRLHGEGTSFHTQVKLVRIEAAKRMLRVTDLPLQHDVP
jgi:AraC-like DNA-binding protein